jgi:hypothetical protein
MNTLYIAHTDQCLYNIHLEKISCYLYVRFKTCCSSKLLFFKCKYWIASNMTKPKGPCHGSGGRRQPLAANKRVQFRANILGYVVDQATLGQTFLQYFRFPCQYHCHQGSTLLRSSTADTVQH